MPTWINVKRVIDTHGYKSSLEKPFGISSPLRERAKIFSLGHPEQDWVAFALLPSVSVFETSYALHCNSITSCSGVSNTAVANLYMMSQRSE